MNSEEFTNKHYEWECSCGEIVGGFEIKEKAIKEFTNHKNNTNGNHRLVKIVCVIG